MTYVPLSRAIAPLRPLAAKIPAYVPPVDASAWVITQHYGDPSIAESPELVNLGVLAVQSRGLPATYFVRPSASQVVHDTDLHSIPHESPYALRVAGIVEARRPETGEALWGDVASLGWYVIKGSDMEPPQLLDAIYLMGVRYPKGSLVARWMPAWTGEDLNQQMPSPDFGSSLIEAVDLMMHHEFAVRAARFLTVFSLLAEVENGPLRFDLDKDGRTRQVRVKDLSANGLRRPPAPRPESQSSIDPTARVLGETQIKGHLQRYRVGEQRARVEWRYVDGYSGRRWFAPRWTVERDHAHSGLANDSLIYRGKK